MLNFKIKVVVMVVLIDLVCVVNSKVMWILNVEQIFPNYVLYAMNMVIYLMFVVTVVILVQMVQVVRDFPVSNTILFTKTHNLLIKAKLYTLCITCSTRTVQATRTTLRPGSRHGWPLLFKRYHQPVCLWHSLGRLP